MFRKRLSVWLGAMGLTVLAISCASQTQQSSGTRTPGEGEATITVSQVELGRGVDADNRVTERVDTFAPNDVVYASVLTNGAGEDVPVRVRWLSEDGAVIEESEQTISPSGPSAMEFHVSPPQGWAPGTYRVEVHINGQVARTEEFTVESN